MALFNVRLDDELALAFDAWAALRGGRSGALRRLMREACAGAPRARRHTSARVLRPVKLTVRLTAADAADLDLAAAEMALTPNAWAAALLRHRLTGRPRFPQDQTIALISIQGEVRRIGVNVNQIARALNTAVLEGKVLDLELAALDALRRELAAHIGALREAFEGNLAYWQGEP